MRSIERKRIKTGSTRECCACLRLSLALERNAPAAETDELLARSRRFASDHGGKVRFASVLGRTIGGLADLRAGRIDHARAVLESQRRIVSRDVAPEYWWHKVREGEIALAEGDAQRAAAAFSAGEPDGKMWLHMMVTHLSLLANNLPSRDGSARAAKARGDMAGAVEIYRGLLVPGPKQKWTAIFEPRYVLEIARLEEKRGNRRAAAAEYGRFLDYWKQAGSGLPELAEGRQALERVQSNRIIGGIAPKM